MFRTKKKLKKQTEISYPTIKPLNRLFASNALF